MSFVSGISLQSRDRQGFSVINGKQEVINNIYCTGKEDSAMNRVWDILQDKKAVVVFDIDGTLTSYSYGEYHAHHELDRGTAEAFRSVDIYSGCGGIKPLQDYIEQHDPARIFTLSMEPHGHEAQKTDMVGRLYGIYPGNCFYVKDSAEKPKAVISIIDDHFPDIDPRMVVCVDDNESTLRMYEEKTPFCTAHPLLFVERMIS